MKNNPKQIIGYVAGYGSLVDKGSLMRTTGEIHGQILTKKIKGLSRTWLFYKNGNDKGAYLDVKVDKSQYLIASIVPVTFDQITKIDYREVCYRRIDITHLVEGWDKIEKVYIYVGMPKEKIAILDPECTVEKSYLDLCRNAADANSPEMSVNFCGQAYAELPTIDEKK